jgi:hypothetical protein
MMGLNKTELKKMILKRNTRIIILNLILDHLVVISWIVSLNEMARFNKLEDQ